MTWGIFCPDDDFAHVIPLDDKGCIRAPHVIDRACPCHPHEDDEVVVHEEIQ